MRSFLLGRDLAPVAAITLLFALAGQVCAQAVKDAQIPLASGKPSLYQVAFCFRPSSLTTPRSPGHAFLAIGKWSKDAKDLAVTGYGFYPEKDSILGSILGPGQVKFPPSDQVVVKNSRFLFERSPGETALPPGSCRVLKHVTKEQFEELKQIFDEWDKQEYSLRSNNCVTMMHETAKKIGLKTPPDTVGVFPESYIKSLWELNPAGAGPLPVPGLP